MKRKIGLLSLLLFAAVLSHAQVSMTVEVPPLGVMLKNQLWNMLLVNAGQNTTVRISMTMLDEKTNQVVLTAVTSPLVLKRGAKQVQSRDLGPITYSYNGPTIADRDPNGLLPAGNYQVCYSLGSGIKTEQLLEHCILLAVDPLSPPLLNTPADEAQIYTTSPQFTWLPPTPAGIFGDLSYDLVLVEVLPGQAKADAIEQNIPVYSGGLLRSLYLNYAGSYKALDTGRLYAWRVVALNNGSPVAMSDIWTFRVVKAPLPDIRVTTNPYLTLKRGLDPSIAAGTSTLQVNYDNTPADTSAHYTITSLNDRGNPIVQQGELALGRGQNLLQVVLSKTAGYDRKKVYLFTLVNGRNESWTLKFTGAAQ